MSHAEQIVREIASEVKESRQEPDRYHLLRINGKLCSPFTRVPVEKSMEKVSILGLREFQSFDQVQNRTGEFLGFWLSPPHILRTTDPNHLQAKLIVYETSQLNGESSVLNRMLLLDIGYSECLTVANNIARTFGDARNFGDSEEVRSNTIFSQRKMSQEEWLPIVTEIINDARQWKMIETGEDVEIDQRTILWVQSGEYKQHIGTNPGSCFPDLASSVLTGHSHILEGKFVRSCGQCGKPINKVIFTGYRCDCGGVYKGC